MMHYLASIVHLFWLFYSKINESLYTIAHCSHSLYNKAVFIMRKKSSNEIFKRLSVEHEVEHHVYARGAE